MAQIIEVLEHNQEEFHLIKKTTFCRYMDLTNSTEVLRPISLFDMYNDPQLYNQGISVGLMDTIQL